MKKNKFSMKDTPKTHEGAVASHINDQQKLRRSVMACMLWEDTFYEDGESIATRIADLVSKVSLPVAASVAKDARNKFHLRHVPLWVVCGMAKKSKTTEGKSDPLTIGFTLEEVIQRPDELTEFLALYWKDGRTPLSHQVKKGLARAFTKFDEYQLAKYNRDEPIKLRDVLFLCHAKPKDQAQAELWKRLVDGKLATPDTWEVTLSESGNTKENWERLLNDKALGGLAFIRNLRNMSKAKVSKSLISEYSKTVNISKVLPFRFVAAAKAAPEFESDIDAMLLRSCSQREKLPGRTVIVVDVSGSMYGKPVSKKSDMDRALAACALAAIGREICEDVAIYATAGNDWTQKHQTELVPARHGMALVDAIFGLCKPLGGGGIFLTPVCNFLREKEGEVDRMIVITDEQDCARSNVADAPGNARPIGKHNYLLNVNSYENGIGYGNTWVHIDGWSESVWDYILESEKSGL